MFRRHTSPIPQLAIFVKGNVSSCYDIPADVLPKVIMCEHLPNADGREAHTMAYFVLRYYDNLPRISVFLQARASARVIGMFPCSRRRLGRVAALGGWRRDAWSFVFGVFVSPAAG